MQFDKQSFPRGLKPCQFTALIGAAEAAPFQSKMKTAPLPKHGLPRIERVESLRSRPGFDFVLLVLPGAIGDGGSYGQARNLACGFTV